MMRRPDAASLAEILLRWDLTDEDTGRMAEKTKSARKAANPEPAGTALASVLLDMLTPLDAVGISQRSFCQMAGIDPSRFSKFMNGLIPLPADIRQKLAAAFGVTPNDVDAGDLVSDVVATDILKPFAGTPTAGFLRLFARRLAELHPEAR